MALVVDNTSTLRPVREYLVEITGIYEETIKHGTLLLHSPSNIYNETNGLCEDGIVAKAPITGAFPDLDIVGKKARFWFSEAHSVYKGNSPKIDGHLLVRPDSIISVDGEMMGEYIYCKAIETPRSAAGIIMPNIELVSIDTLQAPRQNFREFYTDRGVVASKNEQFPEGETLFWGDEGNVRIGWDGGFLVRRRMVLAWGDDAKKMTYLKRTSK
jgi:hypothetical protein